MWVREQVKPGLVEDEKEDHSQAWKGMKDCEADPTEQSSGD